jgi:hypothetical protein
LSRNIDEQFTQEELAKAKRQRKHRIDDSFRRANDIRYKDPKDLKWYQKALFYEIKIREEIKALDDEIEQQEREGEIK